MYGAYTHVNSGREIIKYTVIYSVYIRFWPTLHTRDEAGTSDFLKRGRLCWYPLHLLCVGLVCTCPLAWSWPGVEKFSSMHGPHTCLSLFSKRSKGACIGLAGTIYHICTLHVCMHGTIYARYHICTVLCMHGIKYARYHVCTVPYIYGIIIVRYHVCTVPYMRGTMYVRYHICTVPCMYGIKYVRYHICTVPCMYGTMYVRYRVCTVSYMYGTIYVRYHICTVP